MTLEPYGFQNLLHVIRKRQGKQRVSKQTEMNLCGHMVMLLNQTEMYHCLQFRNIHGKRIIISITLMIILII